ncbi:MAG: hypothetical protein KBT03_04640 [Bacteroidales bacterium]|nr:hypothetical protein [Candidatus Scybalousia scybalohippi]
MTAEYTLREYTQEEYEADLRSELENTSLYNTIKLRCDLINDECVNQQMGYIPHGTIQELMCEILNLIEIKENMI